MSDFVSAIAFVSRNIYFQPKFSLGNQMSVAEWTDTYDIRYNRAPHTFCVIPAVTTYDYFYM